jgi:hypothetical protein
MRTFLHLTKICSCLVAVGCGIPEQSPPAPTPLAVDHVPIAVHSLGTAETTFTQALGFRLKPGRTHESGLQNSFAKFVDGSYLELISPRADAQDSLSRRYVAFLDDREGPAFLALRADALEKWIQPLEEHGRHVRVLAGGSFSTLTFTDPSLDWLFLIEYHAPSDDRPELLEHANTAIGIIDVWLREPSFNAARAAGMVSAAAGMQKGLSPRNDTRPIVGVTIQVQSIEVANEVLREGNGSDWPIRSDAFGHSIFVPPSHAHGLALEFRELRP